MQYIQNTDNAILNFIYNNMHSRFLDVLMPLISSVGNLAAIWIIIALIFIVAKKYRMQGFMIIGAISLCGIIGNLLIKPFVARIRPYVFSTTVYLLIPRLKDYSFPSGHAMAAFAAATVIYYSNRRLGAIAMILASLIAFSRLYLYVHYPSDVIAGMLIGILVAFVTIKTFNILIAKQKNTKIHPKPGG